MIKFLVLILAFAGAVHSHYEAYIPASICFAGAVHVYALWEIFGRKK